MEGILKIPEIKSIIELISVVAISAAMIMLEYILKDSFKSYLDVLFPIILLIIFYIFVSRRIARLEVYLERQGTSITYIEDSQMLNREFMKAVDEAQKRIVTTGGKSTNVDYLSAIEGK